VQPDQLCPDRVAQLCAQLQQVVVHVLVAARVQHDHPQTQRLQPLHRPRRGRGQHQVRPQRGDALDLRIVQAAELGQGLHLGRPVGIAVGADQARTGTQRADAFGQPGHQADDALRRRGASQRRHQQQA
jgi:hypothetical protein